MLFRINASEIARSSTFELLLDDEVTGVALGIGVMNKLLSSSLSDAAPACVPLAFCSELVGQTPSSSLVGKASKTHFTKCWCPLSSRPRETHVRLRSSKASLEPNVPRFLWWFFSLSSNTSRYASNECLVEGCWVECKRLTQSCNSFSVSCSHAPWKAFTAAWQRVSCSASLSRSLAIGEGVGSLESSGRSSAF